MNRRVVSRVWWLAVLCLTVVLYYWKILFTGQYTLLWQWEFANQSYSWLHFVSVSLKSGFLPLWDSYRFSGNTFIGEMQTGLFYPFRALLYLYPIGNNGLMSERAFNAQFVFSHLLAGVFMYLLARKLGIRPFGSYIAAACFALGGFVAKVMWMHMLDSAPWLPLLLYFWLRAIEQTTWTRRSFFASLGGMAFGMAVLAGGIHLVMMDGIVLVTLAAWLGWKWRLWVPPKVTFVTAATVIAFALLMGAVQLLPSAEYSSRAYRWVGSDAPIRSFQKVQYAELGGIARFTPRSIVSFVFGEADSGNHEFSNYFGVLPLLLSVIGAWKFGYDPRVRYLTGLAIAAYLYSWGSFSFIHGALYLVPLLDVAREAGRFIYLTHFAMALLAGFAASAVFDRKGETWEIQPLLRALKWPLILFALALAGGAAIFGAAISDWTYLSFFLITSSVLLLAVSCKTPVAWWLKPVVALLIVSDLYAFNWTAEVRRTARERGEDYLQKVEQAAELAGFFRKQAGPFRVRFAADFPPNIGNAYGIEMTGGMSATMLTYYADHLGHARMHDLFNVRYVIHPKAQGNAETAVYSDNSWSVEEVADFKPRAWFVRHVRTSRRPEPPLQELADMSVDLQSVAYLSTPSTLAGRTLGGGIVEWRQGIANRLEMTVRSDGPGFLVVSEVDYPGWVAEVDGREVPIHRVNGVIRGVEVPDGSTQVVMRYAPRSVYWGVTLSGLGLVLIIGLAIASARGGRLLRSRGHKST